MPTDIGVQSAVLIDGTDVTGLLNEFQVTNTQQALDVTTFRPANYARKYITGLLAITAGLKGFCPLDYATANTLIENAVKTGRQITIGVGGFDVGNLAFIVKALKVKTDINVMTDGILSVSADYQGTASSPALIAGNTLFSPHGSSALTQSESQTFIFTNTDEKARLGVRKNGGSTIVDFVHTSSAAVNLKAALESLYGGTWSVSGTLSTTGSTPNRLYSGTLTATAGGTLANVDVPQCEIVGGEVQVLNPTSPSGNYTFNGSANFTPGDAVSAILTKIQASTGLGGATADGTSTAAVSGTPSTPVFDAVSNAANTGSGSSRTWSHTVGAGLNRYLIVTVNAALGVTTSGVTFNGAAMTQITAVADSHGGVSVWGLVAPATGTFNVVASFSTSTNSACTATSYSNVDQVTPQDATPVTASNATSSTTTSSITTVSANSMLFASLFPGGGGLSVTATTSGATLRGSVAVSGGPQVYTGDKPTTTAGSSAFAWSYGSSVDSYSILLALRGYAAPSAAAVLTLNVRIPASLGNVSPYTVTGTNTGTTASTTTQGALLEPTIADATSLPGYGGQAIYNVLSSTSNGTALNNGASTNNGAEAILQVLPCFGATPSITVKIQHSVDGTTWIDLIAFDAVTSQGAQRKSLASGSTINQYTRAMVSAISGIFVIAVVFARL